SVKYTLSPLSAPDAAGSSTLKRLELKGRNQQPRRNTMKARICLLLAVLLATTNYPCLSQTPAPKPVQQQDESRIRIGTAEVALHVIVRDKKGHPVRDLSRSDFEVYEDGARQNIESFRLVVREPTGGGSAGGAGGSAKPGEHPVEGSPAETGKSSGLIA